MRFKNGEEICPICNRIILEQDAVNQIAEPVDGGLFHCPHCAHIWRYEISAPGPSARTGDVDAMEVRPEFRDDGETEKKGD